MTGPTDDTAVLTDVARGVVALAQVDRLSSFTMPYPDDAQAALDRLTLTCLLRTVPPPRSLADLVRWCGTRPLRDWPLRLPHVLLTADDHLVDVRRARPTRLCREWAADGDPGPDLRETDVKPERRLERRLFLAAHPVISKVEAEVLGGDRRYRRAWRLVHELYGPVPAALVEDGEVARCATCGAPAAPLPDGGRLCEREDCPAPEVVGERFPAAGALALPAELRAAVIGVGRLEQSVVAAVQAIGGFAVDEAGLLRVVWPDGRPWRVVLRDNTNPVLLAREIARVRLPVDSARVLVVVPGNRLRVRRDYRDVFAHELPDGPELVTDDEVADLAHARSRQGRLDA